MLIISYLVLVRECQLVLDLQFREVMLVVNGNPYIVGVLLADQKWDDIFAIFLIILFVITKLFIEDLLVHEIGNEELFGANNIEPMDNISIA